MRKRIYRDFIALILICVFCLSAPIIFVFYSAAKNKEIETIRESANLIAEFMNANGNGYADFTGTDTGFTRMSVIAPDGRVLIDSLTDASVLENHADREEFAEALACGTGESMRYSDTTKSEVCYYAVRLESGDVLRVSRPVRSVISAFTSVLPAILGVTLAVLILARFAALRLTDIIVKPINEIDFNAPEKAVIYDELAPYMSRIEKQKNEISAQFEELKNRAATINLIAENMKEGLVLTSRNGSVLKANKSASSIFGENDITGANILHICRESGFVGAVKRCLDGENSEIVFYRNGKVYSVFFSPSQSNGEIDGVIILFFDSTQKALAEKQRREFSANVSHELKTPLTAILGLSEMIESGMAKQEHIAEFAGKISEQTRRLIDVISDIIKLSEFDEGVIGQSDGETFDILELAKAVIANLSRKAAEKNVAVELTGAETRVKAEKLLIEELLGNLIDNAINYNNTGGSVTVDISTEGDYRVIAVTDTGIGIPAEHQSRVFERFYRADKSRSKKTGGTGLGLSIVKHVAEEYGGRVELESEVGKGTTVRCYVKSRS